MKRFALVIAIIFLGLIGCKEKKQDEVIPSFKFECSNVQDSAQIIWIDFITEDQFNKYKSGQPFEATVKFENPKPEYFYVPIVTFNFVGGYSPDNKILVQNSKIFYKGYEMSF